MLARIMDVCEWYLLDISLYADSIYWNLTICVIDAYPGM